MIEIVCGGCGQLLSIPEEYAGKVGKCRNCSSRVAVPPPISNTTEIVVNSTISNAVHETDTEQVRPKNESNSVSDTPAVGGSPTSTVYTMTGVQDLLEVYSDRLAITPKGLLGFFNKGLKGRKEIPYASIVAVQLRNADLLTNGYIQFTLPGGNESRGGIMAAVRDENTMVFSGSQNNALANEIRNWIMKQVNSTRASSLTVTPSLSQELQKLVSLKEDGLLSDEEFIAAKAKLLL